MTSRAPALRPQALARLDKVSTRERLALFA